MNLIILFIFWLVGIVITSFTLVSVLIILFFGIPTTRKLEKMKMLKENNGILKRYLISITILLVIFLITLIVTFLFVKNGLAGFLVGAGMTFIFSLGKTGKSQNNVSDYMETNQRHFSTNLDEVARTIVMP